MIAPTKLPNGSRVWLDSSVREFTDALTRYDDRLALIQTAQGGWEIWRVDEQYNEYIVARSKPGVRAALGPGLIAELAKRDMQGQGRNRVEQIIRHNEKVEKDANDRYVEGVFNAVDKALSKSWRGRVPSNIEDLDI